MASTRVAARKARALAGTTGTLSGVREPCRD
jgi:hypothetical protein